MGVLYVNGLYIFCSDAFLRKHYPLKVKTNIQEYNFYYASKQSQ